MLNVDVFKIKERSFFYYLLYRQLTLDLNLELQS